MWTSPWGHSMTCTPWVPGATLAHLARSGRVVAILGGPPCRSVSRLRHRAPGPRPVRGRDDRRFGLSDLTVSEKELVVGDLALLLKQCGLWLMAWEAWKSDPAVSSRRPLPPAFLMESPRDAADYMEEESVAQGLSVLLEFPGGEGYGRLDESRRMSILIKELLVMRSENLQLCWWPTCLTWKSCRASQEKGPVKKPSNFFMEDCCSPGSGRHGHRAWWRRFRRASSGTCGSWMHMNLVNHMSMNQSQRCPNWTLRVGKNMFEITASTIPSRLSAMHGDDGN